jgi:hypothetical protein
MLGHRHADHSILHEFVFARDDSGYICHDPEWLAAHDFKNGCYSHPAVHPVTKEPIA